MEWIILLTSLTAIIFIALYYLQNSEVRNLSDQLSNINENKTSSKILLSTSKRQFRRLAVEINRIIDKRQKTEIEHTRMEQELRQAISNMSHDLRTPLTSIKGYLQLIEDNNISETERSQYLDIVKRRAESLQALIESFYDLSRLEGKEYKFEFEKINLHNMMCDIIASFYNDFLNKDIEPVIEIEEKVKMIFGDKNGVRRVIENLIQNMLKYGSCFVRMSLKQYENYIITAFENDAPDLTEEDASRLFERFFTADRTRSNRSTGLGLSITKQLIEQMGHSISAELLEGRLIISIKWYISK